MSRDTRRVLPEAMNQHPTQKRGEGSTIIGDPESGSLVIAEGSMIIGELNSGTAIVAKP